MGSIEAWCARWVEVGRGDGRKWDNKVRDVEEEGGGGRRCAGWAKVEEVEEVEEVRGGARRWGEEVGRGRVEVKVVKEVEEEEEVEDVEEVCVGPRRWGEEVGRGGHRCRRSKRWKRWKRWNPW